MTVKTRINADGTITVPLLGAVQASGLTTSQLGAALAQGYRRGGYLDKPSVNVEVTAYGSKTVTVLGAVPKAGLYALD
ncbi:polysaccharide biosynthesis/export family protein, partial [Acinetobacter baumannii]